MGMIEDLKELGVNTEEGLKRLNGNQSFYERMLRSVPKMLAILLRRRMQSRVQPGICL